jgi:hypothetical protein
LQHRDFRWFFVTAMLAMMADNIEHVISYWLLFQLLAPGQLRGRLIGLFSMSAFGLRAFSGVTVGVVGGLIGIHWSLAISAMALMAVTFALLAFAAPTRGGEIG